MKERLLESQKKVLKISSLYLFDLQHSIRMLYLEKIKAFSDNLYNSKSPRHIYDLSLPMKQNVLIYHLVWKSPKFDKFAANMDPAVQGMFK